MARNSQGRFEKGESGNPAGRPSTTSVIQAAAEAFASGSGNDDARYDSWSSQLTGIGSEAYDKRQSTRFHPTILDYRTIARLWETEAMVAKGIEAPAAECFREGFEIDVEDEQNYEGWKEDIEDALLDLGVEDRLERAHQLKRAYGAGLILLGINDGRPLSEPLNEKRTDLTLDYLDVFEPLEMVPYSIYDDPNQSNYGSVATYRLSGSMGYGAPTGSSPSNKRTVALDTTAIIHESRLIVFNGTEVSRYYRSTNLISPYFGTSVVPRFYDAVRDLAVAFAGVGLLMTDSGQPVITMPGLREQVAKSKGKLHDRMAALNLSRSIARAILLDRDEKFERQTTNFAGMPDVLDRQMQWTSANVDIPLSVMIGYSPATLGKADDSEMKLWFNATRKRQRREFTPPMRRIVKFVIPKLGKYKRPKRWGVRWLELERMTTLQNAEARRVQAQIDSIEIKAGMADPDELRKARYSGKYSFETFLDPKKKAPGFLAPLPAGVLQKAMSPEQVAQAVEAGELPPGSTPATVAAAKPTAPGLTATSVKPHVRRNPRSPTGGTQGPSSTGPNPAAKGNQDSLADLARARREQQRAKGALDADMAMLLDELELRGQREAHAAGNCYQDCPHCTRTDEDSSGRLVTFAGFRIVIESPQGTVREWTDNDGSTGTTTMKYDYGYIEGSEGADGDSLDVYLGPDENSPWVFVVDQMNIADGFASFDEKKCMIGFASADAAMTAYLGQYSLPGFFGGMTMASVDTFRKSFLNQA